MAEETIDVALKVTALKLKKYITWKLQLYGWKQNVDLSDPLYFYDSDKDIINSLADSNKDLARCLSEDLGIIKVKVVWAV